MSDEIDLHESDSPEWWALGRETCQCEHHYDIHLLQRREKGGETYAGRCLAPGCECEEFQPLDK